MVKTPLKANDFVLVESSPFPDYVGKIAKVTGVNPGWDNPIEIRVGLSGSVCRREHLSNAIPLDDIVRKLNATVDRNRELEGEIALLKSDNEYLEQAVATIPGSRH